MRVRPTPRRLAAIAASAVLAALLTACDPPTSIDTTVVYNCQANPGGNDPDGLQPKYTTVAPQAVAPGSTFAVKVIPETFTLDASSAGGTVTQLSNMVWRVRVPAGTTLSAHMLTDHANVGTPTSTVAGDVVAVTIPGPILSGVPATLPTLTMALKATAPVGSRIEPKIAGTSHANPGLTFTARVDLGWLGTIDSNLACYPNPSPALQSILVSNDVLAPRITIASPVADQVVVQGSTVLADYSCDDGDGVGVASCTGTVADGAPINTSTLGSRTFTVTATDHEGKVGTKTVTYTVVAA